MPTYRTLTLPRAELEGLCRLASWAAANFPRPMDDNEAKGLRRADMALRGEKLPGHAPGRHRGPEIDLIRKRP